MRGGWNRRSGGKRCAGQVIQVAGIVLMAAGVIVLLFCIPCWAWAALLGIVLVALGFILLRLDRERR